MCGIFAYLNYLVLWLWVLGISSLGIAKMEYGRKQVEKDRKYVIDTLLTGLSRLEYRVMS
jgi:glucosamine 6-phosphate synthetase-like amidotransferase/phosphosugar isomerase protein